MKLKKRFSHKTQKRFLIDVQKKVLNQDQKNVSIEVKSRFKHVQKTFFQLHDAKIVTHNINTKKMSYKLYFIELFQNSCDWL